MLRYTHTHCTASNKMLRCTLTHCTAAGRLWCVQKTALTCKGVIPNFCANSKSRTSWAGTAITAPLQSTVQAITFAVEHVGQTLLSLLHCASKRRANSYVYLIIAVCLCIFRCEGVGTGTVRVRCCAHTCVVVCVRGLGSHTVESMVC